MTTMRVITYPLEYPNGENSDGASFAKDSDFLVRGLKRPLLSIWHLPRPIWPSMMHNDHVLRCAPPNGHPTDHFQRIFGQVLLTIQRCGWPGRRQGAPSTSQPGPNPPGGVAMGEGRGSFAPATRWCPPAVPPRLRCTCPIGATQPGPLSYDRTRPLIARRIKQHAWARSVDRPKAPQLVI